MLHFIRSVEILTSSSCHSLHHPIQKIFREMYSPISMSLFAGCIHPFFFFLLRPQWKPSYCTYCNSILSLLCFLHSGFIFLGTNAINIWITYSIFIVYLSVSRRDQLLSESEPHLVFVIILILLILLSPEPPCFSLQECEIMNMVRAETFQKFQNDMLTLEPMKESIEKSWRELNAISYFVDTMKSMSMFVKCTAVQG